LVDDLLARGELGDYHLAWAARADFLRRLGRDADARSAYEQALSLARIEPERRLLRRRLDALARSAAEPGSSELRGDPSGSTNEESPSARERRGAFFVGGGGVRRCASAARRSQSQLTPVVQLLTWNPSFQPVATCRIQVRRL